MDLNILATLATIFGAIAILIGAIWGFLKHIDAKLARTESFVMKELKTIDERYILKEHYTQDRQEFLNTLSEIKRDIVGAVSGLTTRMDTIFTHLVNRDE